MKLVDDSMERASKRRIANSMKKQRNTVNFMKMTTAHRKFYGNGSEAL
jgi:CRISPR/Cas system CMR subunit Cmr6 (Cas7 group RAMP superfamily)